MRSTTVRICRSLPMLRIAKRWAEQLRGHGQTVGERLERDRAVPRAWTAAYRRLEQANPGRVGSHVWCKRGDRLRRPSRSAMRVLAGLYVDEAGISCGSG